MIFQSYLSPIQTVYAYDHDEALSTFNPTLVQFKQQSEQKNYLIRLLTFNPTLVQFKQSAAKDAEYSLSAFNPTLVQFKLSEENPALEGKKTFNPTLVQFKRRGVGVAPSLAFSFQSYLSPIQTF